MKNGVVKGPPRCRRVFEHAAVVCTCAVSQHVGSCKIVQTDGN